MAGRFSRSVMLGGTVALGSTIFTDDNRKVALAGGIAAGLPYGVKGVAIGAALGGSSFIPNKGGIIAGAAAAAGTWYGLKGGTSKPFQSLLSTAYGQANYGGLAKTKAWPILKRIGTRPIRAAFGGYIAYNAVSQFKEHPGLTVGTVLGGAIGALAGGPKAMMAGAALGQGAAYVGTRDYQHGPGSVWYPALAGLGIAAAGGMALGQMKTAYGLGRGAGRLTGLMRRAFNLKYPALTAVAGLAIWGGAKALHEGNRPPEMQMAAQAQEMNGGISHNHMNSGNMALASHYAYHPRVG